MNFARLELRPCRIALSLLAHVILPFPALIEWPVAFRENGLSAVLSHELGSFAESEFEGFALHTAWWVVNPLGDFLTGVGGVVSYEVIDLPFSPSSWHR